MEIAPLFYRLFKTTKSSGSHHFLGTAFPVVPDGGLITCRHVLDVSTTNNESLSVYDNEKNRVVPIDIKKCILPKNMNYDLAFIPNALGRRKDEFFPLLTPSEITIGEDVYSYGYFSSFSSEVVHEPIDTVSQGYFKGNIVNFSKSPRTPSSAISLSYPVIEGLSGSPVLTYHNGAKVVGMCYGNIQSRVVAKETIEYKDKGIEYKETINRIVEFGQSHHVSSIVQFLRESGINNFIVSSD